MQCARIGILSGTRVALPWTIPEEEKTTLVILYLVMQRSRADFAAEFNSVIFKRYRRIFPQPLQRRLVIRFQKMVSHEENR